MNCKIPEIFRGHLSPLTPDDAPGNTEVKTKIEVSQVSDALKGLPVACAKCKEQHRIIDMYRCFYCRVWYCYKCSKTHFDDLLEEKYLHGEKGK